MSSSKTYYQALELRPDADSATIKHAYRRLARLYHPDVNNHDHKATFKFQEIQSAYEVLSDPRRRKTYDLELKKAGRYAVQVQTFEDILKQSRDLLRYTSSIDRRQLNSDALAAFVLALLDEDHLLVLKQTDHKQLAEDVCSNLLMACQSIIAPRLYQPVAEKLSELFPDENHPLRCRIQKEQEERLLRERQNRRVPLAALGIILLIILLMGLLLRS